MLLTQGKNVILNTPTGSGKSLVLRDGEGAAVDNEVVMDEFHWYADRGVAWQVSLLTLPQAHFHVRPV